MTVTAERKANMQKASSASNNAKRKLIALHREEYDNIHGDERVSLGLPREPTGQSSQKLQERKKRLEAQLAQLNEKLGIEPSTT